jgi:hypothetical protein
MHSVVTPSCYWRNLRDRRFFTKMFHFYMESQHLDSTPNMLHRQRQVIIQLVEAVGEREFLRSILCEGRIWIL